MGSDAIRRRAPRRSTFEPALALTRRSAAAARRRPRVVERLLIGAVVLLTIGGAVAILLPDVAEQTVGEAKVAVDHVAAQVRANVTGELPTVTLGAMGPDDAMDTAPTGTFVGMESYRMDGVPPVYAAHNNRGGDILLAWEPGQQVRVIDATGASRVYALVDERVVRKHSEVDSLTGMGGEFVLQSCFYGSQDMRFVGLSPVPDSQAQK